MPKVIAIDGAASSGKSTVSKFLSKKYNKIIVIVAAMPCGYDEIANIFPLG